MSSRISRAAGHGLAAVLLIAAGLAAGVEIADAKLAVAPPGSGYVVVKPPRPAAIDPGDKQHQAAIRSYVEQHDVSEQVAKEHLSRMGVVDDPAKKLIAELGDDFAQLYFDNDSGRYVVALSPTGTEKAGQQAAADIGIGEVQIARRAFNHSQLTADAAAVIKRAESLTKRGEAKVAISRNGIDVVIAADVADDDVSALKARSSRTPVNARRSVRKKLDAPDPAVLACWNRFCNDLIAGTRWRAQNNNGCTMAFHTGLISDPSRHMMLTAGHCMPATPANAEWGSCKPWVDACTGHSWDAYIGPYSQMLKAGWAFNTQYGGGGGDNAALEVHPFFHNWNAYSSWWHWGNNAKVNIWGYTQPVVGETVCHGGSVTGIACGNVQLVNWSFTQSGNVYMTGMAYAEGACAQPGDSGGPVTIWHGGLAYGINNGGFCNLASQNGQYGLSFDPMERSLNTSGLQLYGG